MTTRTPNPNTGHAQALGATRTPSSLAGSIAKMRPGLWSTPSRRGDGRRGLPSLSLLTHKRGYKRRKLSQLCLNGPDPLTKLGGATGAAPF